MAIDVTQLTDYSWSDIAKAAKMAMMNAALGGANYTINGRQFGRISIDQATKLYDLAMQSIADESMDSSGGIGLVKFGERQ